jgi:hypothetical protein
MCWASVRIVSSYNVTSRKILGDGALALNVISTIRLGQEAVVSPTRDMSIAVEMQTNFGLYTRGSM